ncbi:MAG: hypothetical protein QOH21_1782 [Acidobacteriota bacterium]|nr:hypothetical protein [Acidobacteriota bacterium]
MTIRMWISPPPTWKAKPPSHRRIRMMMINHSKFPMRAGQCNVEATAEAEAGRSHRWLF